MERSGCNSWDRLGHSARELERQAAGDILICAAMCKGMHLQPGSVPVIRPAGIFSEDEKENTGKLEEVFGEQGPSLRPTTFTCLPSRRECRHFLV